MYVKLEVDWGNRFKILETGCILNFVGSHQEWTFTVTTGIKLGECPGSIYI